MEQKIVEYCKKYPAIGAVKIKRMMEDMEVLRYIRLTELEPELQQMVN